MMGGETRGGAEVEIALTDDQIVRQAVAALRGYTYQLYETALAWLALRGDDQVLFVEVAEDFAILAGDILKTFQVKDAPSRSVTLRDVSVVKVLNGWWSNRVANPSLKIGVTYLTTAMTGREKGIIFPGRRKGIEYWGMAAKDADVGPLRAVLLELDLKPEFATWITDASDQALREVLLQNITWRCGADNLERRRFQVAKAVRNRPGMRLALDDVQHIVDAIVLRLLEVASGRGTARLTTSDLDSLFEAAATVTISTDQLRQIASRGREAFRPPLYWPERDEAGGRLFFFGAKDRVPLVGRTGEVDALYGWLASDAAFSWALLSGPGGAGKSRLGLELCLRAVESGWQAGFLPMASEYSAAESFVRFDPDRPTLMVIDYAGDDPVQVGALVRILCERAAAEDLEVQVRVLLLDRAGFGSPWVQAFHSNHERFMDEYRGAALTLPPLRPEALASILRHLGDARTNAATQKNLEALSELDPQGRPLFAALAGDALRQGREIGDFDRDGLLDDVLVRERRYWRRYAESDEELRQHLVACALATMTGPINLPHDATDLTSPVLPFNHAAYKPRLMAAITGRPEPTLVAPLEPDMLGEWLTLDVLSARGPFDEVPGELRRLAEKRVAQSESAAAHFGAFRLRAVDDFPEEAVAAQLLAPPGIGVSDTILEPYFNALSLAFPALISASAIEAKSRFDALDSVKSLEASYLTARARFRAKLSYISALQDIDLAEEAELFRRLKAQTIGAPTYWWEGQDLATLGDELMVAYCNGADFEAAEALFLELIDLAAAFQEESGSEEVGAAVAIAGLRLRRIYLDLGREADADRVEHRIWDAPAADVTYDLAARAGEGLMVATHGRDSYDAYDELKRRVQARPEVIDNVFFAACCGVEGLNERADDESDAEFLDRVWDVIHWLESHQDVQDVSEAINYIIEDGMMSDDFGLGPVPITMLFNSWADLMNGGRPSSSNELTWLRHELESALAANQGLGFANEMEARMADLIALRRTLH